MQAKQFDELVPRSQVTKEFGVCSRSIKRWEEAKLPGLDEPIVINGHKYHKRSAVERAKAGRAKLAA